MNFRWRGLVLWRGAGFFFFFFLKGDVSYVIFPITLLLEKKQLPASGTFKWILFNIHYSHLFAWGSFLTLDDNRERFHNSVLLFCVFLFVTWVMTYSLKLLKRYCHLLFGASATFWFNDRLKKNKNTLKIQHKSTTLPFWQSQVSMKGAWPEKECGDLYPRLLAGVHRWGSVGVILSRIRQTRWVNVRWLERRLSVQVIVLIGFSSPCFSCDF